MLRIYFRMTRICFHPASLRASESNVYLHTCVRIFVWLRQYSLRASLSGLAPFSHRHPPGRVKQRCAFRLRVRLQPLLASTRPWSLFTDIGVFSCQLFYRDAIFFSSPQLAKKRRQIRYFFLALLAPYLERA